MPVRRLQSIRDQAHGRVRIVLHGTNGFPDDLTRRCIATGVSKINVNRLVLDTYNKHLQAQANKLCQTQLIDEGIRLVQDLQEYQFRVCGSAGRV